jgi:superfamily II RNA helicase
MPREIKLSRMDMPTFGAHQFVYEICSVISDSYVCGMLFVQDLARRIARVSVEAKLDIKEDVYVDQFKPFLMDVVHSWCKGASFLQLCKMTTIFEGNDIGLEV